VSENNNRLKILFVLLSVSTHKNAAEGNSPVKRTKILKVVKQFSELLKVWGPTLKV